MRLPGGRARGCPQSLNGRLPPIPSGTPPEYPGICWKAKAIIPGRLLTQHNRGTCNRSLETLGSGRQVPTLPIRVIAHPQARKANTTANSCVTKWCYAAAPALRPNHIYVNLTATFFFHRCAGSSPAYGWLMMELAYDQARTIEAGIGSGVGSGP